MKSPIHTHAYKSRQTQRGVSLIELMVAITIGLLILAALSTLLISQTNIRNELDKSNRMIDNGRYALELLSENIRLAGFYDNYDPSGAPRDPALLVPTPCLPSITNATTNTAANVLLHHVQGYNAATESSAIASPPCSLTSLKNGSDILVLRRTSTSSILATAAVAGSAYFQVSNCKTDVVPPSYKLALGPAGFTTLHKRNCSTASDLRLFVEQTYFVSPDNVAGDGIPTLKRIELDPSGAFVTTPLVEGIEYMQVEYGLDGDNNADGIMDDINGDGLVNNNDLDGAADIYIAAPTAANWPNIVSIKAYIIARNIETTTSYTDTKTYSLGLAGTYTPASADHYKRHAYTQLIRLVNPSSRKEAP